MTGAKATWDLERGDTVISLPESVLLTANAASESPIGSIFDAASGLSDQDVIILFMVWILAKPGEAGRWESYSRHLTNTPCEMPGFMPKDRLQTAIKAHNLDRSAVMNAVQKFESDVDHLEQVAQKLLASDTNQRLGAFNASMVERGQLGHAKALYKSRCFPARKLNLAPIMAPGES